MTVSVGAGLSSAAQPKAQPPAEKIIWWGSAPVWIPPARATSASALTWKPPHRVRSMWAEPTLPGPDMIEILRPDSPAPEKRAEPARPWQDMFREEARQFG